MQVLPDWQHVGPVQLEIVLAKYKAVIQNSFYSPETTTLSPLRRAVTTRRCSRCRCVSRACCGAGGSGSSGSSLPTARAVELALDERKSSLAVFLAITLVNVGVVSGAAVRVSAITVALNLGCGLLDVLDRRNTGREYDSLTEQL